MLSFSVWVKQVRNVCVVVQEAKVLLALIARGFDVEAASGRTDWGPSALATGGSPRAPILQRYRARRYV